MIFRVDEAIWGTGNLERYVPDYIKKKKKEPKQILLFTSFW